MIHELNQQIAKVYNSEPNKEVEKIIMRAFIGKQNDVVDKCLSVIKWYETALSPSLGELFEKRKELVTQSVYLAVMTGVAGKHFRTYHVKRKVQFSRDTYNLTSTEEKMAVSRAEHKAYADGADMREKEAMGESAHEAGRLFLSQINQVLFAMQQEIADLRKEQANETY